MSVEELVAKLVPYLSWNFIPLFASFDPNDFVGFGFVVCDWDEVVRLLGEELCEFGGTFVG